MHNKRLGFVIYTFDAIVLIALDQLVKFWAIANLQGQPERPLIQGFLHLLYVENTGAAFGFLAGFGGAPVLFTIVKLALLSLAVAYFVKLPPQPRFTMLRLPILLIFAGGVGNLIDRVRLGFVVDMFVFRFIEFPVFNVADVYVTVGVFWFALMVLFVVKDAPLFGVPKKLHDNTQENAYESTTKNTHEAPKETKTEEPTSQS